MIQAVVLHHLFKAAAQLHKLMTVKTSSVLQLRGHHLSSTMSTSAALNGVSLDFRFRRPLASRSALNGGNDFRSHLLRNHTQIQPADKHNFNYVISHISL